MLKKSLYALVIAASLITCTLHASTKIRVEKPTTETAGQKNVLLLGDDVMFAYKKDVLKLMGDKANCTFISMPQTANPNWEAFFKNYVATKKWDVIHFTYGRELMLHVDANGSMVGNPKEGKPRGSRNKVYGIFKELIDRLSKTDTFLIGQTITPSKGKSPGYDGGIYWTYKTRFKGMLGPASIKVNDLEDYTRTRLDEMVQNNSHLPTKVGAQLMAEQVVNSILEAFNEGSDPNRPRILIVGDSIVGGYYTATRNLFAGKANVYSGGTTYNDPNPNWKKIVDGYISKGGEKGWDVIQFNWGLHAMKYVRGEKNKGCNKDDEGARIQFEPAEYIKNMKDFIRELKRTKAHLVFATTTPIPSRSHGSIQPMDQTRYNNPAKELMKKNSILINDLYSFAMPQLNKLQINENVHFTKYGSEQLAEQNFKIIYPLIKK